MRVRLLGPPAALVLGTSPALAQERDWNLQVTPFLWGSGIGGEVTPPTGGPTVEFDESLSDVLEDLDAAFFLSAYARRGRWVFLGDVSASTPRARAWCRPACRRRASCGSGRSR